MMSDNTKSENASTSRPNFRASSWIIVLLAAGYIVFGFSLPQKPTPDLITGWMGGDIPTFDFLDPILGYDKLREKEKSQVVSKLVSEYEHNASVTPPSSSTPAKPNEQAPISSSSNNLSPTPSATPSIESQAEEFTDKASWVLGASSTRKSAINRSNGSTIEYAPENVLDGRVDTAWAQGRGKTDDGIGEWLQVNFPNERIVTKVGIITGYPKLHPKYGDLFQFNNRIKKVRLDFSNGTSLCQLDDVREMQTITLPDAQKTQFVRFTIEDVYPATSIEGKERWHDTLIAEVAFWGRSE